MGSPRSFHERVGKPDDGDHFTTQAIKLGNLQNRQVIHRYLLGEMRRACEPGYKRGGRPRYSTWRCLRCSDARAASWEDDVSASPVISVLFAFYTAIEKH